MFRLRSPSRCCNHATTLRTSSAMRSYDGTHFPWYRTSRHSRHGCTSRLGRRQMFALHILAQTSAACRSCGLAPVSESHNAVSHCTKHPAAAGRANPPQPRPKNHSHLACSRSTRGNDSTALPQLINCERSADATPMVSQVFAGSYFRGPYTSAVMSVPHTSFLVITTDRTNADLVEGRVEISFRAAATDRFTPEPVSTRMKANLGDGGGQRTDLTPASSRLRAALPTGCHAPNRHEHHA